MQQGGSGASSMGQAKLGAGDQFCRRSAGEDTAWSKAVGVLGPCRCVGLHVGNAVVGLLRGQVLVQLLLGRIKASLGTQGPEALSISLLDLTFSVSWLIIKAMYSCRETWPSLLGSTVSRMAANSETLSFFIMKKG